MLKKILVKYDEGTVKTLYDCSCHVKKSGETNPIDFCQTRVFGNDPVEANEFATKSYVDSLLGLTESNNPYDILKKAYKTFVSTLKCKSSLGFTADATDESTLMIDGLIYTYTKPVLFRDCDNKYWLVSLEDLQTLKLEVFKRRQDILQQKWDFEERLKTESITDFQFR